MDLQVVPTLDTLRQWLDDAGITFFECDSCQALHLPHMQNFDGIFNYSCFFLYLEGDSPKCFLNSLLKW